MNCLKTIDNSKINIQNNQFFVNDVFKTDISKKSKYTKIDNYFFFPMNNNNTVIKNINEYQEVKEIYKTLVLCCNRKNIHYNLDILLYIMSFLKLIDIPLSNSKVYFTFMINDSFDKIDSLSFDHSLFTPNQFYLRLELKIKRNNIKTKEVTFDCSSIIVEDFNKNDFRFPIIWNYKYNKIHSINNNSSSLGIMDGVGSFYPYFLLINFFNDRSININY